MKKDIRKALLDELDRLGSGTGLKGDHVYVGSAGITLMKTHIFRLFPHDEEILSRLELIKTAKTENLKVPYDANHVSFLETSVGNATLLLERGLSTEPCTTLLQQALSLATEERVIDDDGCEVLYGRAGLLYAFLRLRSLSPSPLRLVSEGNIRALVESIIHRGKLGASVLKRGPPLMWSWHQKRYLGAAHGAAGILHMLLLCPNEAVEPFLGDIVGTIEWLVDLQDDEGNWGTRVGSSSSKNELIQWCHGSPGILILLCTLKRRFPHLVSPNSTLSQKIQNTLERASSQIYTQGLLRKGIGICHGTAGSIYALLALGPAKLDQAIHLAHLATNYENLEMRTPDRPNSLYEGLAGMCCAWAEVLKHTDGAGAGGGMPGFSEEFLFGV